jgi:molecular chaperone HtpG
LKSDEIPAVIMADEQSKRMKDMSMMYGAMRINDKFPTNDTLILNTGNPVIKKLAKSGEEKTKAELTRHIYELALLAAGKLEASDLGRFLKRSSSIIEKSLTETPGDSDKPEGNSGEDE